MASPSHKLLQYSPARPKSLGPSTPIRKKQPSPEKKCPQSTTVLSRIGISTATDSGSPTKKQGHGQVDTQFEIDLALGQLNPDLASVLAKTKRVELSYRLVNDDGNATGPPDGDWSELKGILKGAYTMLRAVELSSPYLIVRFKEVPPSPWPFTIGGLPLRFTDSEYGEHFNPGVLGKGKRELQTINLRDVDKLSEPILKQAVAVFQVQGIKVYEIFHFDNYWSIVIPDQTDLNRVPSFLAHQACCYRFKSEILDSDHAALRAKVPKRVDFDDTNYAATLDALLRPGVMITSSAWTAMEDGQSVDMYKKTTSGVLVVNKEGEWFITVATHGFEADGLVYHPNPKSGSVIGRIVEHLPGTDISIAKLNPGLRYINNTFGSETNPDGIEVSGISPGHFPHLRKFDSLSMDNPYSGYAEGLVLGIGYKLADDETELILHSWNVFENGSEPVDSSCGCPILDEERRVVGLFRFKVQGNEGCLAVSAMELRRFGYEVCGGEQQF